MKSFGTKKHKMVANAREIKINPNIIDLNVVNKKKKKKKVF